MSKIRLQKTFSTEDYNALNQLIGVALAQKELAQDLITTYNSEYATRFNISASAWEIITNHQASSLDELIRFIAEEQTLNFELPKENKPEDK